MCPPGRCQKGQRCRDCLPPASLTASTATRPHVEAVRAERLWAGTACGQERTQNSGPADSRHFSVPAPSPCRCALRPPKEHPEDSGKLVLRHAE